MRQVSQFNEALYRTFVSPWVRAAANPWSAAIEKRLHPMRTSRYLLSEKFLPWMHVVAAMAKQVRQHRVTAPDSNPFRAAERAFSGNVAKAIEAARQVRDRAEEQTFRQFYG